MKNQQRIPRRYQPVWETLKTQLQVSVKLTRSDDPLVIKKYARTFRKAVQKEKYIDDDFKFKFPYATLTTEIEGNMIHIELHLNKPLTLEDLS